MLRGLLTFVVILGVCTSAMATVVSLNLSSAPVSSTYNRLSFTVYAGTDVLGWSSSDHDLCTTDVETGSYMLLDLDYDFDPLTREVTSVSDLDFTGGSFNLTDFHFDLKFYSLYNVDVDGVDVGGTFNTPSPPAPISGASTATFATEYHEVIMNRGNIVIDSSLYSDTMSLSSNPQRTTTEGTGTINTTLTSLVGGVATYDVELLLPIDFEDYDLNISDPDFWASLDGSGTLKATGSFSVGNLAPVAHDDPASGHQAYYQANEDNNIVVTSGHDVLINDVDSETLQAVKFTDPSHGEVTLNSNGTFTYTPDENWNGTDSFTYKAYDGDLYSNAATVNLTINSVNDAPDALADSYSCEQDEILTVYSNEGLLDNDSDVDDDHSVLEASLEDNPSNGVITWWSPLNNGSFTYRPNPGFSGTDSFTYKAYDDEFAYSELTTVLINVLAAPVDIPGDTNDDDIVNETDAAKVALNWEKSVTGGAEDGDFNGDGWVNATDASIMAANWGDHTTESSGAVPEPSALFLLVAGLMTMGLKRRRVTL